MKEKFKCVVIHSICNVCLYSWGKAQNCTKYITSELERQSGWKKAAFLCRNLYFSPDQPTKKKTHSFAMMPETRYIIANLFSQMIRNTESMKRKLMNPHFFLFTNFVFCLLFFFVSISGESHFKNNCSMC